MATPNPLDTLRDAGLLLIHGEKFAATELCQKLRDSSMHVQSVGRPEDLADLAPALILIDAGLLETAGIDRWRDAAPRALLLAEDHLGVDADFLLPTGLPERIAVKTLQAAARQWVLQKQNAELEVAVNAGKAQLMQLNTIGIALSAERNLSKLLRKILDQASLLASCDAASLFLVDKRDPENPQLVFKLTKNDSVELDFKESKIPLDEKSLAGYVALTGEILTIGDAYELGDDVPYSFNKSFDESLGYRTRSMLVIPMENHRGEVIGVLQFINRKDDYFLKLSSPEVAMEHVVAFSPEIAETVRALASQAAVAIQNAFLLESINQLFDGFVQASVMAIEQRDPTTSGHSFRVADLTVGLAQAVPKSNFREFRDVDYSETEIREIRYASLLHDFGKVGVREHVLVKAKKLMPQGLNIIRYRIALEQERIRARMLQQQLDFMKSDGDSVDSDLVALRELAEREMERLNGFLNAVEQANEPTMLPAGAFEHLQEIHEYRFRDVDNEEKGLISDEDMLALAVRKGSLTEYERKEIESHVVHTWEFLKRIPWTGELASIPEIAGKHHEKLDGTGYPDGSVGSEIPLQSRMMTVSDIYDALTASDRPYKPAMSVDRALGILELEAKDGKIDANAVQVFIDAKVYKVVEGKEYGQNLGSEYYSSGFAHHVCDVDLHD